MKSAASKQAFVPNLSLHISLTCLDVLKSYLRLWIGGWSVSKTKNKAWSVNPGPQLPSRCLDAAVQKITALLQSPDKRGVCGYCSSFT